MCYPALLLVVERRKSPDGVERAVVASIRPMNWMQRMLHKFGRLRLPDKPGQDSYTMDQLRSMNFALEVTPAVLRQLIGFENKTKNYKIGEAGGQIRLMLTPDREIIRRTLMDEFSNADTEA